MVPLAGSVCSVSKLVSACDCEPPFLRFRDRFSRRSSGCCLIICLKDSNVDLELFRRLLTTRPSINPPHSRHKVPPCLPSTSSIEGITLLIPIKMIECKELLWNHSTDVDICIHIHIEMSQLRRCPSTRTSNDGNDRLIVWSWNGGIVALSIL
jgi:hypothetical protein